MSGERNYSGTLSGLLKNIIMLLRLRKCRISPKKNLYFEAVKMNDNQLQENFIKYLNRIFEASKSWARISSNCEKEKILFSIGYVRSHLIFNGLLPEEEEKK
jgi:hypothetical protein